MSGTVEDIRTQILLRLRARPGANVDWHAEAFQDLAPTVWKDGTTARPLAVDVSAALWQLVQQGIIIPGHRSHGRFDQNPDAFRGFPFFSVTSYGREVLAAIRNDTDPADAADYLDKLKARAPSANVTVLRYVGEAVATFNSQKYLASAVLLGVAAETLLEQLYESLGKHLGTGETAYLEKLQPKRWVSQRLEYARSRLEPHLREFPADFQSRVEQYLDMLAQVIKMSRDDVGHARPLRVDPEIAAMNPASFPVLASIVDELMTHLLMPCSRP